MSKHCSFSTLSLLPSSSCIVYVVGNVLSCNLGTYTGWPRKLGSLRNNVAKNTCPAPMYILISDKYQLSPCQLTGWRKYSRAMPPPLISTCIHPWCNLESWKCHVTGHVIKVSESGPGWKKYLPPPLISDISGLGEGGWRNSDFPRFWRKILLI